MADRILYGPAGGERQGPGAVVVEEIRNVAFLDHIGKDERAAAVGLAVEPGRGRRAPIQRKPQGRGRAGEVDRLAEFDCDSDRVALLVRGALWILLCDADHARRNAVEYDVLQEGLRSRQGQAGRRGSPPGVDQIHDHVAHGRRHHRPVGRALSPRVRHVAEHCQGAGARVAQGSGRFVFGPHRVVEHERVRPVAFQVFRGKAHSAAAVGAAAAEREHQRGRRIRDRHRHVKADGDVEPVALTVRAAVGEGRRYALHGRRREPDHLDVAEFVVVFKGG